MQFIRNTSMSKSKSSLILLIKVALILVAAFLTIVILNKIDFPSPNKKIEKIIPDENLKIIK
jgi:hypothetical protein